jgi:hypothetical protein
LEAFGLVVTFHDEPSHTAVNVWNDVPVGWYWNPTATHDVELVHDTPFRYPATPKLPSTDHDVPFHNSVSGTTNAPLDPLASSPTAMHMVGLVQLTSSSWVYRTVGSGLGVTDHVDPSQCSARLA